MLVRVIDYQANPGGGCRFVAEMLRAFGRTSAADIEVVSHGPGATTYANLLGGEFPVVDIAPRNAFRTAPPWIGIPGGRLMNAIFRTPDFHFSVPPTALSGCDVVWFPWLHRHRIPEGHAGHAFATFHDCIGLEFPGVLPDAFRRDETVSTRRWLESNARIVFTSHSTVADVARLFGGVDAGVTVVPLSAKHERQARPASPRRWPFSGRPYLLCPINLSPHKNLESLLDGYAAWGARHPLVITGPGTDLESATDARQRLIRGVMERGKLVRNRDVFALGYVDDADYYAILDGAWAMVMPTLAEGGGSFPVLEAMEQGIPVISSDIPVMREMSERWNGRPMWCDARNPLDIAASLALLEERYDEHRRLAKEQVPHLVQRSWDQVALEYATLMGLPLRRAAGARLGEPE